MNFDYTPKVKDIQARLLAFFDQHIYPNEHRFHEEIEANRRADNTWVPTKVIGELKLLTRKAGLWNLFLPRSPHVPEGLPSLEYTPLCKIIGRVPWAPGVFNCSVPDTGNMETLERYTFEELKDRWLEPLSRGKVRSAFLITEPAVISSDVTNIECRIERQGNEYVINGRKWWSSGAGDSHYTAYIVTGKTDPDAGHHEQQSTIVVSANAPGIAVMCPLLVFGYDDAPHGHMEVSLKDMRMPVGNILFGEGRGFEIAQGRLGPGRIHHCIRNIDMAKRALELTCKRLSSRIAFDKAIVQHSIQHGRITGACCMIEQVRLLTLRATYVMDTVDNKVAKTEIAMIKVVAPDITCQIVDWAIQAHSGGGMSGDFPLVSAYARQRTLRLADSPDEMHRAAIAKLELIERLHLKGVVDMPVTHGA